MYKVTRLTSVRILAAVGVLVLSISACALIATWFEYVGPRICPLSPPIVAVEDAIKFGKQHFLQDRSFWSSIGIDDSGEVDLILSHQRCCSAAKGDYFVNDSSRWGVFIWGETSLRRNFQYEVFFSECGEAVRVEKIVTR